jgi:hypothetical protein
VGGFELGTPVSREPTLKYHPDKSGELTCFRDPEGGQCLVGSLTGAVASKIVTEAREGSLSLIGNQAQSVMA